MLIIDITQGTPEWLAEKAGKPSASNISRILTSDGKPSKQREGYMLELAAERVTGRIEEGYKNSFMEVGQQREQEARDLFCMINDVVIDKVGVVYKDEAKLYLCSPDGIINGSEGIEIKNPLPKTQAKYLIDGELPSEYFAQVQFSLYVTGFKLWHFFSQVPAMRPLHIKVTPDAKYHEALDRELPVFCRELEEMVTKIK